MLGEETSCEEGGDAVEKGALAIVGRALMGGEFPSCVGARRQDLLRKACEP